MFPGELDGAKFLLLNAGLFGLLLFFGGLCFCTSCIFNDTKWSTGVSSAVIVASILLQMLADVGAKFDFLRYTTPLTLFDTDGIIAGDTAAIGMFMALYGGGIVLYFIGTVVFCRKDLPL